MEEQDARRGAPQHAGGRHVVLLLLDHHGTTHGAGVLHPVRQRDGDDDDVDGHVIPQTAGQDAPGNTEDEQCHQQHREGELHVGNAHDEHIQPAAPITGQHAQGDADEHGQQHGQATDQHRHAQPIQNGGPDITPLVVGTQPVAVPRDALPARRREGIKQIECSRIEGVLRGDPGGGNGQADAGQQHQQGNLGQARPGQAAHKQRVRLAPAATCRWRIRAIGAIHHGVRSIHRGNRCVPRGGSCIQPGFRGNGFHGAGRKEAWAAWPQRRRRRGSAQA